MQSIKSELERLQLESEEVTENKFEIAKNFSANWEKLSCIDKRMFLMQFVEKIVVENIPRQVKSRTKRTVTIFDVVFVNFKRKAIHTF